MPHAHGEVALEAAPGLVVVHVGLEVHPLVARVITYEEPGTAAEAVRQLQAGIAANECRARRQPSEPLLGAVALPLQPQGHRTQLPLGYGVFDQERIIVEQVEER